MCIRLIITLLGVAGSLWLLPACSLLIGDPVNTALDQDEKVVLSIPRASVPRAAQQAYKGPHPSTITRPEDPFPFPIPIDGIGPIAPLFAGPLQYPFLCQTEESYLGQPLVDNQEKIGIPIFAEADNTHATNAMPIGYSKDCLLPTRIHYFYNRAGTEKFYPIEKANNDIAKITRNGREQDFIVRVETGTINRFIYVIAMLKGPNDAIQTPDTSSWNKVLIYQFNGGIGIGFNQGKAKIKKLLHHRHAQIAKGYAIAYSTGNETNNNFNIWLQEDTALRVKKQFQAAYATPQYTVGIGGSGGGLQQYLLAQNRPGLIDAAIPQYSYPDMITQTLYALDCDPMEYYFDVTDRHNRYWQTWENRTQIEGLSARSMKNPPYANAYRLSKMLYGYWPSAPTGISECSHAWRGPAQVVINPRFHVNFYRYHKDVYRRTHWSHWEDVHTIYGKSPNGFAHTTWDNVGVQYGLEALKNNEISVEMFLDLNKKIGGWRSAKRMKKARLWFIDGRSDISDFSLWSHHNINLGWKENRPAPRTQGNLDAIEAAYRSGMVFLGKMNIPTLDIRHYLDGEQDMHHSFASLAARKRIQDHQGNADNHRIWVSHKDHDVTDAAFDTMHQWMLHPTTHTVQDACFTKTGDVIAQGSTVWDGKWNGQAPGTCTQTFPLYQGSRQVAGEDAKGMILKCQLQSITSAIQRGVYGPIDMGPQHNRLTQIFPQGVCDYQQPSQGMPLDLLTTNPLWAQRGGTGTGEHDDPAQPTQ